jgi:hemerythrin superfamily protein
MVSKGSKLLADDHVALDRLLKQLQTALSHSDVNACYASLDLFWAKLAVHIRAEHIHLFPGILKGTIQIVAEQVPAMLNETRATIERLRADHDFFIHQLAKAVENMRRLLNVSEQSIIVEGLIIVRDTISEIERKLADHNRIEESQIYQLAGIVLSTQEQAELAKRISSELEKRPPRFAGNIWA